MQLNRALVFLCLVIAVGAQRELRVTCYLDVLTPRTHEGPCSHVIIPSAQSSDSFDLQSLSEDDYDALRKMKERKPALKILLGLEVKASRLELMLSNETSVENFIHTALRYWNEKRVDGLDLTWVNDLISDESVRSTKLLTRFLKSLRGAFEGDVERSLLLSVSLSDDSDISALGDEQTLSQYVDFVSILPVYLEKDELYINRTVQRWRDQQVDLQKLSLAIPAFLRRSRRRHHHHRNHPGGDDTNIDEGKKYHMRGVSSVLANQVCQVIKSGLEKFITLTSLSDERGLDEEVSWLLQKGFGSIGVVFIDVDVFCNAACANMTRDERAMVESKMMLGSHHGSRVHDLHQRRKHQHGHGHGHHHPNVPHGSHENGHRHHRHHHHDRHHGYHGHHRRGHHHHHHHHQPHPTAPQNATSAEGLE